MPTLEAVRFLVPGLPRPGTARLDPCPAPARPSPHRSGELEIGPGLPDQRMLRQPVRPCGDRAIAGPGAAGRVRSYGGRDDERVGSGDRSGADIRVGNPVGVAGAVRCDRAHHLRVAKTPEAGRRRSRSRPVGLMPAGGGCRGSATGAGRESSSPGVRRPGPELGHDLPASDVGGSLTSGFTVREGQGCALRNPCRDHTGGACLRHSVRGTRDGGLMARAGAPVGWAA